MDIRTMLAHSGLCSDSKTGAISTPIYQTATFRHEAVGHSTGYDYSRTKNPTREALEQTLAALEGGARGFAFSSGMAAITAVASLFSQGDEIIVSEDLYGGTYRVFDAVFRRFGITALYVDTTDCNAVEEVITIGTKGLFIETPSNPMMKITDLAAVSAVAKKHGMMVIADNTFMTPYLQQPIQFGADIVIHSGSKYLGGHNDVLCGIAVSASKELGDRIGYIQNATGGVLSPFDSWLMLRGLKTLSLRMDCAETNSKRIVEWLMGREDILEVNYPGIETGGGYETQKRQARGFGGMISFRVKDRGAAVRIINNVKVISYAESLGGVESLITYPLEQTHGDVPRETRERLGVTDNLLRLSVGIEHHNDLIDDLKQAMEK